MAVRPTTHATSVRHANPLRPAAIPRINLVLMDVQPIALAVLLAELVNLLRLLPDPEAAEEALLEVHQDQAQVEAHQHHQLLLTVTAILVRADIQPLQADAPMDIQRQVKHVLVEQKAAPAINVNLPRLTVTAILARADIQPLQADAPMDIQQQVKHVLVGQQAEPAINVNLPRLTVIATLVRQDINQVLAVPDIPKQERHPRYAPVAQKAELVINVKSQVLLPDQGPKSVLWMEVLAQIIPVIHYQDVKELIIAKDIIRLGWDAVQNVMADNNQKQNNKEKLLRKQKLFCLIEVVIQNTL